jgi:ribosomal protein L11 methyltransferase
VAATDPAQVELAIAAWELAGVHNSSVEYEILEPTEEPWPGHDNRPVDGGLAEVAVYLAADRWTEIEPVARTSAARLFGPEQVLHVKHLPNRDWRTAWHDHFDIVRIRSARPIVVRPPHIPYDPSPDEIVLDLVPGLAFGTGQHQSTRLSLSLLAEQITGGERVLDVGTGSGILAVAAARLGAASVVATDIDPLALDAARQTARQNQLSDQVEVLKGSIPVEQQFDVVTANLTADILQYLARDLTEALNPGGRLIASGLIAARQMEVVTSFNDHGLSLQSDRSEDDWRTLLFCSG